MIDRDRDLCSIDLAHIGDKQAFALRPFLYRTPAAATQDMDSVWCIEHALYGSEATLDKKSRHAIQYKSECGDSLTLVMRHGCSEGSRFRSLIVYYTGFYRINELGCRKERT